MAVILGFIFALVVFIGMLVVRRLPPRVQYTVIAVDSLTLGAMHLYVASTQLGTIGLAARNRVPDYGAQHLGYILVGLALANLVILLISRRLAMVVVVALAAMLPYLYFKTW